MIRHVQHLYWLLIDSQYLKPLVSAIIYTFLGSSKDLAVGPQSLMSLLTAEYCTRPENWVALANARNGLTFKNVYDWSSQASGSWDIFNNFIKLKKVIT